MKTLFRSNRRVLPILLLVKGKIVRRSSKDKTIRLPAFHIQMFWPKGIYVAFLLLQRIHCCESQRAMFLPCWLRPNSLWKQNTGAGIWPKGIFSAPTQTHPGVPHSCSSIARWVYFLLRPPKFPGNRIDYSAGALYPLLAFH